MMTKTWNISALEDRLRHQFDAEHSKKTLRSLESVIENQGFCHFHYKEVFLLQNEKEVTGKSIGRTFTKRIRKQDGDFITAIRAHTNALLRCLHSNSDLLAHFIYFCLNLERSQETVIGENSINLYRLKEKIENKFEYENLHSLLVAYTKGDDYKYLKDWGNHTKHWSNISVQLTYNLKEVSGAIYSWNFEAFSFRENSYPKKDALAFIEREYNRQSELLPQIIEEVDLLNAKLFEN